ncbi:MAG: P-II family nitrogen regulator [Bacillota bacterium]|nr:P-II family nitrogen regulator [Bacillota bacterium]
MKQFECVYFIGHHGLASWVLRFARNHGIFGGTICFGTGTAKSFWLNLFELSQSEKEVLIMVAERGYAFRLMKLLDEELTLKKYNHGITFSLPAHSFTGGTHKEDLPLEGEEADNMYDAITIVVNKGNAEEALEAAQSAGAVGGTIINARGAGRNETSRFFMMDIEPEKEILMMLVEKEKTEAISQAVHEKMKLEDHGNGVMFVQPVSKAYGLYQGEK